MYLLPRCQLDPRPCPAGTWPWRTSPAAEGSSCRSRSQPATTKMDALWISPTTCVRFVFFPKNDSSHTDPLLVDVGQEEAVLLVQVVVQWIVPVLRLHQADRRKKDRNSELFPRLEIKSRGRRGTKRTASAPSRCKLRSWGLCGSCCTSRSFHRDTWAGRTLLCTNKSNNSLLHLILNVFSTMMRFFLWLR